MERNYVFAINTRLEGCSPLRNKVGSERSEKCCSPKMLCVISSTNFSVCNGIILVFKNISACVEISQK